MDNEYLDIIGLGIFKALNDKRYPILVNGKISESAIPTSITNSITSILSLIPDAASSENKLADKNFVNSSIATNTATFRGTFDDLATLQSTSADINDYAFYVHTDEIGNTAYDRYKHNGSTWVFEYTLNNSSFTAEQWNAINSGITTTKVGNYDAHLINYSNPHKVTKSQVGLGNVENVALSSWAGSNKITTLGTITTGVWNGTKITNTYLANSSITIGTTAISLGSTAKSLAGIEKLQLNDANSNLVYDSTTGSWKLTGNLLVTGFISAGAKGNSSSGGGSTYTQKEWLQIKEMTESASGILASAYAVKEAYNELNIAIEALAGKATNVKFTQTLTSGKQIGSISIDGKSTSLFAPANYAWSEVTGKPSFATVATSGSYTDLANKPTIASLMGSTAIGGTSSYLYWNGSAWATKALGSNAFTSISKVSQLTNDSGYITGITKAMVEDVLTGNITSHTHSYLPLSGGTVTGPLTINTVLDRSFILDESEGEKYHIISFRASGEEYAYLLADNKGSENKLVFNGSTILHSSNVGSYALKLDGSNAMTGGINWNNASVGANVDTFGEGLIVGRTTDSGTTLDSLGYKYASVLNVSNGVYRFQIASAASNANKLLYRGYNANAKTYFGWETIAFTNSNVASASKWATARTITLTGSVTGSVSIDGSDNVSLATTTNHTHNYLPLSGGTLSGHLVISSPARIKMNGGIFEFNDSSGNTQQMLWAGMDSSTLSIWSNSNWYSILHSGNYNSYAPSLTGTGATGTWGINISGNAATATNADNLDGYHKDEILRKTYNPTSTISLNDVVTIGIDFTSWDFIHSVNVNNQPFGDGAPSAASVVSFGTSYHIQIYSDYNNTSLLYYRSYYFGTGWKAWRQFAFIDSNVASATKLANSRTIWGQSFDGTGNVSGALSGVTDINKVLHINSSGNVTIGNSDLAGTNHKLYVGGKIRTQYINLENGNEINCFLDNGDSAPLCLNYDSSGNIILGFGGGNVGIGTISSPAYKLHIVGAVYSTAGLITDGAISAAKTSTSSDIRLKDNISEIGSKTALNWLLMLKPKSWTWNDKAGVKGASMGFIAQDVESILPQMVKKQDNGYLSLDYTQLHALEVSAIQSHENEIERLKDRVSELEAEINRLKQYAN